LHFPFSGQIQAGRVYIKHDFSLYSKYVSQKNGLLGEQLVFEKQT